MIRRMLCLNLFAVLLVAATATGQLRDLIGRGKDLAKGALGARAAAPAVTDAEGPAAAGGMMLWVERNLKNKESALHSELVINGKTVNIFTSDTWEPIDRYLQQGWNTISIKTTAQEPASDFNDLIFRIGPARRDPRSKAMVMDPVVWKFRNGEPDWKLRPDGTLRHALGPKVKEVEVTMQLYFAGLQNEAREIDNGDLVLIAEPNFDSRSNTSVSATIFINDTPITSFTSPRRQIVITPFLKKGKNEIKVVSARVRNALEDNDVKITIAGPARWNATEQRYMLKPLLQSKAMQGWMRDSVTGRLVNRAKPDSETIERILPLLLKDDDAATE